MKEAKVKNVFEGELFYDPTLKHFFRRARGDCKCGGEEASDHIPAEYAADGRKVCFLRDYKVIV